MIVIAVHNRIDLLNHMLGRLSEINLNGHQVLFVDTNSDKPEFLEAYAAAKAQYPKFMFDKKDYACWDSGAYLHAYRTYQADCYHFLQDSISLTNDHYFSEIDQKLNDFDVVPLYDFPYRYDSEEQRRWAEDGLAYASLPDKGIFGPIFSARKSAMDQIPIDWHREPNTALYGMGMERRWSLMFHMLGVKKSPALPYEILKTAHSPYFTKYWCCKERD